MDTKQKTPEELEAEVARITKSEGIEELQNIIKNLPEEARDNFAAAANDLCLGIAVNGMNGRTLGEVYGIEIHVLFLRYMQSMFTTRAKTIELQITEIRKGLQ